MPYPLPIAAGFTRSGTVFVRIKAATTVLDIPHSVGAPDCLYLPRTYPIYSLLTLPQDEHPIIVLVPYPPIPRERYLPLPVRHAGLGFPNNLSTATPYCFSAMNLKPQPFYNLTHLGLFLPYMRLRALLHTAAGRFRFCRFWRTETRAFVPLFAFIPVPFTYRAGFCVLLPCGTRLTFLEGRFQFPTCCCHAR